jgi:uncharacterized protein involved in exopolysaccharide biosynthesis
MRFDVPTLRDILSVLFHNKRLFLIVFGVAVLLSSYYLFSRPPYAAELKILVERERAEPLVTPQATASPVAQREPITEQDINSEVELLQSNDLLRHVVLANGLQHAESPGLFYTGNDPEEAKVERAIRRLSRALDVMPVPKTDLLSVTYHAKSPAMAQKVLSQLSEFYLEKNASVHHPAGDLAFFKQEADRYEQRMHEAEAKLASFSHENRVVNAAQQSSLALQRADEFSAHDAEMRATIAEQKERLAHLEEQERVTPTRVTATQRSTDNPQLLETMKSSLLHLRTQEGEMGWRYQDDYPPLRDVRREIAQTQEAIQAELNSPVRESATDRNPVVDWIKNETAQTTVDLHAQQAGMEANATALAAYRDQAEHLLDLSIEQHNLERNARMEEESYLLYRRKQEESRINGGLDSRGFLNVAIAAEPIAPALPEKSLATKLILASLGSFIVALLSTFLFDAISGRIETPDDLAAALDVPVLASVPQEA